MFAFILLLTLNLSPSLAVDLDDSDRDYCTTLVASRFVKPDEAVPNEDFYFCHPSIPNAYLKCVVGRPEKSEGKIVPTRVLEEQELVCGAKGFFNTDKKVRVQLIFAEEFCHECGLHSRQTHRVRV